MGYSGRLNRRGFLRLAGYTAGGLVLARYSPAFAQRFGDVEIGRDELPLYGRGGQVNGISSDILTLNNLRNELEGVDLEGALFRGLSLQTEDISALTTPHVGINNLSVDRFPGSLEFYIGGGRGARKPGRALSKEELLSGEIGVLACGLAQGRIYLGFESGPAVLEEVETRFRGRTPQVRYVLAIRGEEATEQEGQDNGGVEGGEPPGEFE